MADTAGGSLLPVAPAFRIDVQMGGVKFDASANPGEKLTMEVGERRIDSGEFFPGMFTVRDASGVYAQYDISNGQLVKSFDNKEEFENLFRDKVKILGVGDRRAKLASVGIPDILPMKVNKETPTEQIKTVEQSPIVETETQTNIEQEKPEEITKAEMATQINKNTIGISSSVKEELRKILKDDAKLNEAVKLLNETEPGKLRSNIIFNPEYKVVADLIKSIVAFKIKEYVDMLEEGEKTLDQASTLAETLPEETSGQNVEQTLDQASTSPEETSDQNVDQTLVQASTLPKETSDQADTLLEETSVQNVGQTSDQLETLPENQTANLPETNISTVNTTLFENNTTPATTTNQSGGKTKKTKGKLRKLKTRKQRKVNRQ
jgi:hypothetical protein